MRLHHTPGSPHCASVRIALAEKGLAWAGREVDCGAFEQLSPGYLARQPSGLVPLLEDGGCVVSESFFILLYLDETHPASALAGVDARVRYQVQKWGKYVETHIAPNLALLRWAQAAAGMSPPTEALDRLPADRRALWDQAAAGFPADDVATARAVIETAAARLAAKLAAHDWLAGDAFTLADIAVFPHAARFAEVGVAPEAPLAEWLARVAARPSVMGDRIFERELLTMGPERGRWG